jgi:hypothetical protein
VITGRFEGKSGAPGRAWSSSKWPHTSSMNQRSVRLAPLISGTIRSRGPLPRAPLPALRGSRCTADEFTADEQATVHRGAARVRAAVDWLESAVDTGNTSLDEGLARLLRGE